MNIDNLLGNYFIDWDEYRKLLLEGSSVHTIYDYPIDRLISGETKEQRIAQHLLRVVCKEKSRLKHKGRKLNHKQSFEIIEENAELVGDFVLSKISKDGDDKIIDLLKLVEMWAKKLNKID